MTVKELIAELSKMDPNRLVVQQNDSEGNGYRLVRGVDDNAAYEAENSWSGSVLRQTLDEDDRKAGFTDEDIAGPNATPCVVVFPVN
jgi:hypothetical protein